MLHTEGCCVFVVVVFLIAVMKMNIITAIRKMKKILIRIEKV